MKKRREELTEQEDLAFTAELARMFIFGSACLYASADNLDEDHKGWPPISVHVAGMEVQIPLCDALDVLYESSRVAVLNDVLAKPFGAFINFSAFINKRSQWSRDLTELSSPFCEM